MLCIVSDDAWICGEMHNPDGEMSMEEAEANAALIAKAANNYARLRDIEEAARNYFNCAVQDEAAERACCSSDLHHAYAKELRDALSVMSAERAAVGGERWAGLKS